MLKILYAASNNENAKIMLWRFLQTIKNKPYIIKIAAYKKSSPPINIDWTLDCLLNMYKPDKLSFENNDNLLTYYQQVKYYSPDLIISDLEYFTSYIANQLNIDLWQCSSSLINFSLNKKDKYDLGLFKIYSHLFNKNPITSQRTINIIENSTKNFLYSHFGDMPDAPILNNNFEWIRPYHKVGKQTITCKHNIVAALMSNNKKILSLIKNYPDSIVFNDFTCESYNNIKIKNINNQEEYYCNLRNSNLFICEGQESFLADAFYNNKYSIIMPNFTDAECITNSVFSEKRGFASCVYDKNIDLQQYLDFPVIGSYNDKIQYLHEKIEEMYA